MTTATKNTPIGEKEVDNLKLHYQMYERRLRLLKEREGMTDNNARDGENGPSFEDENNE